MKTKRVYVFGNNIKIINSHQTDEENKEAQVANVRNQRGNVPGVKKCD